MSGVLCPSLDQGFGHRIKYSDYWYKTHCLPSSDHSRRTFVPELGLGLTLCLKQTKLSSLFSHVSSKVKFKRDLVTEDTEHMSAKRERTLGSLEADSDHMPGKAAKKG